MRFLRDRGVQVEVDAVSAPGPDAGDPAYADDDLLPPAELLAADAGPNPAATSRPTLVRNPDDGSLLLFGGHSGGDIIGQLWRFRFESGRWEKLSPQGGPIRGGHSAVWDPGHHEMIVFGGVDNLEEDSSDLFIYSPAENRWRHVDPSGPQPRPRKDHTAVWDPVRGKMLVFGGHATPEAKDGVAVSNELWAWRPAEQRWTLLQPAGPRPLARHGHTAVWDSRRGRMVVYGGLNSGRGLLNDAWAYGPAANRWTELHPALLEPETDGPAA